MFLVFIQNYSRLHPLKELGSDSGLGQPDPTQEQYSRLSNGMQAIGDSPLVSVKLKQFRYFAPSLHST